MRSAFAEVPEFAPDLVNDYPNLAYEMLGLTHIQVPQSIQASFQLRQEHFSVLTKGAETQLLKRRAFADAGARPN